MPPPREVIRSLRQLYAPQGSYFQNELAVARADALDAHGTFVAINNVVSQSVPHLHAHVVPRRRKDGLRGFFWPRQKYVDASEMAAFADSLRTSLSLQLH